MPGGDGSGPMGVGPMTGRQMGYCATGNSNLSRRGFGLGMGRGFGRGLGRANVAFNQQNVQPVSNQDELSLLKNQAKMLENTLTNIGKRISELQKK